MSNNEHVSPPDPSEGAKGTGLGCFIVAAFIGVIVAFAPLVVLDIRVSGFALLLSVPIGIVIALAGFAGSLVGAAKRPDNSTSTNLPEMLGERPSNDSRNASNHNSAPTNSPPNWDIPPAHSKKILNLNIVATIVIAISTAINVSVTISSVGLNSNLASVNLSAVIIAFQLIPVPLSIWLLVLAIKTHLAIGTTDAVERFTKLERIQRVVGIGSVVWFLVMILGVGIWANAPNFLYIVAGFAPTVTGIVAMTITLSVREKLVSAAKTTDTVEGSVEQ